MHIKEWREISGRKNSDNTKTKQQKNVIFIAQEP